MKKLLNLFILILLLSILGCNNNITRAGGTLADIGKNYNNIIVYLVGGGVKKW